MIKECMEQSLNYLPSKKNHLIILYSRLTIFFLVNQKYKNHILCWHFITLILLMAFSYQKKVTISIKKKPLMATFCQPHASQGHKLIN